MLIPQGLRRADPAKASLLFAIVAGVPLGAAVVAIRDVAAPQALLAVAAMCVVTGMAAFDIYTRLAPNRLTLPATGTALAGAALLSLSAGVDALAGAAVLFATFLLFAFVGRGDLGFGDVKAAALCGAITGVRGAMPLLLVTFAAGMLVALLMVTAFGKGRKDTLAFTPFLSLGVVVTLATADVYLVS